MRTKSSIEKQIEKLRANRTELFYGDNLNKWQMMDTIQKKIISLWSSRHRIDEGELVSKLKAESLLKSKGIRFTHWIINLGTGCMVSQHRTLKTAEEAIKRRRCLIPSQKYEVRPMPKECPVCHGAGVLENKRHAFDECPMCCTGRVEK